ncbi:phage holin [Staphylococcus epidermidis]|uniref:phage holin n=1 Tax=Staphylococcus epidermidis TaxID=1282 RepID=UPI0007E3D567|nr:phage holin [Staphylococcus epidermidis]MBM6085620.1 phage holin [Staphylococcus epidermidis]MBM6088120.1 phage holin [Staphylococcus epidermidis]MBM6090590.1 phage holin [Staphylococcus epidermidis]MBM6093118.1 phage holin [Staphylococcus epidermidis]MBM6095690.1 phage holin [Staphylococcus epidermidis]
MKINWKIRFKKKSFWVAIVSAIILFVNNITQALGLNYTEQLEQISDGVNGLLAVLVTFGVIQDPTTKGLKDSGITQTYTKPRDENIDPVGYQKEGYEPEQWNDDFAEEVEIEEGLRDVEDDEVIVDNFDSDINNSGVMLDTSQQVEGAVENGENTNTDK